MDGIGNVGIAFRMEDMANYYLLEFRQQAGGYKRILRVEDGVPTEIARREDGGYISGIWYSVVIKATQSKIIVSHGLHN